MSASARFGIGFMKVLAHVPLPLIRGFGYVLGRDQQKARLIALCDALFQCSSHRAAIEREVLAPLRARIDDERQLADARTAATRVNFFTLVRGED